MKRTAMVIALVLVSVVSSSSPRSAAAVCPTTLVATYSPGASACAINATGSDRIDVSAGQGHFGGTLDVVVQGDDISVKEMSVGEPLVRFEVTFGAVATR